MSNLKNTNPDLTASAEDEVDLEQCAKSGITPKRAHRYKIKVDREYYVVHQHFMTGKEILITAGKKPPEAYLLFEKLHGHHEPKKIELDQVVEFTKHGVERFITQPCKQQDGGL